MFGFMAGKGRISICKDTLTHFLKRTFRICGAVEKGKIAYSVMLAKQYSLKTIRENNVRKLAYILEPKFVL